MTQLFCERYSKLINEESFLTSPPIHDFQKTRWLKLLLEFNEDHIIYPNRFNCTWEATSYISTEIYDQYYSDRNIQKSQEHQINLNDNYSVSELFDITELWHQTLSDSYKSDFVTEFNKLFSNFKLPWRLMETGRIIKIDSSQFGEDIKNHAQELLRTIKSDNPIFLAAYQEYCNAKEKRSSKDYLGAILEASKSYESILKIITGEQTGTADQLIKTLLSKSLIKIPNTINKTGFGNQVLNSLPYLRNKLSVAHGSGESPPVEISAAFCNLAINLVSTLNIFLIEVYEEALTPEGKKQSTEQIDYIPF